MELVIRYRDLVVRVPLGNCYWDCAKGERICGAHGAMAERIRSNLAKTAAKRDRRLTEAGRAALAASEAGAV